MSQEIPQEHNIDHKHRGEDPSRRTFLKGLATGAAGVVASEAAGFGFTRLFESIAQKTLQPKKVHQEREAVHETPKLLRLEDVKGELVRELHAHPFRYVGEGTGRKADFSIDNIMHPTDRSTIMSMNTADGHGLIAFQLDPQTLMKYQDGTMSALRFEYNTDTPSSDPATFPETQYVVDVPLDKVLALLNAENAGKPQAEQRLTVFMGNKQPILEHGYDNVLVVPSVEIPTDNQLAGAGVSVTEIQKGITRGADGTYTLDQQGQPTLVLPFFDLIGGK